MQMKLMFACFFIGLYAQFGQSWLVVYWGEGCCGLDDTLSDENSWKLTITRIILGFGTLFAFICLMLENRKSSLSIDQKMEWEKWSLTTARLAGGLTLIAPLFWYISFRMNDGDPWNGEIGMTFRLVILAGILGLLATKANFSHYGRLTSSVSDAMHRTNVQKRAQFSIVVIFFSMFMPYYQLLGLGITGGEFLLAIIELIFFIIAEFLSGTIQSENFDKWFIFPITDFLGFDNNFQFGHMSESSGWGESDLDSIRYELEQLNFGAAFLLISSLLLLVSAPIIFSLTGLAAAKSLISNGYVSDRIGRFHVTYFLLVIFSLVMAPSSFPGEFGLLGLGIKPITLLGFGFWSAGIAGFGLLQSDENTRNNNLKHKKASNDDIYQHYFDQLIAQGYEPKIAEDYAKKYTEQQLFSEALESTNSDN